jgi:hypothetical protein
MIELSADGAKIGMITISLLETQYILEHIEVLNEARQVLCEHRYVTIISYMPDIVWDEEDDMSSVQEVITITIDNYFLIKFNEAMPELQRWVHG